MEATINYKIMHCQHRIRVFSVIAVEKTPIKFNTLNDYMCTLSMRYDEVLKLKLIINYINDVRCQDQSFFWLRAANGKSPELIIIVHRNQERDFRTSQWLTHWVKRFVRAEMCKFENFQWTCFRATYWKLKGPCACNQVRLFFFNNQPLAY